jgi:hypothetical protein
MGKQSIAWHEAALEQTERHVRIAVAAAETMLERAKRQRAECERYRAQIERAKREGRDGFDAEKFLPKKGGE